MSTPLSPLPSNALPPTPRRQQQQKAESTTTATGTEDKENPQQVSSSPFSLGAHASLQKRSYRQSPHEDRTTTARRKEPIIDIYTDGDDCKDDDDEQNEYMSTVIHTPDEEQQNQEMMSTVIHTPNDGDLESSHLSSFSAFPTDGITTLESIGGKESPPNNGTVKKKKSLEEGWTSPISSSFTPRGSAKEDQTGDNLLDFTTTTTSTATPRQNPYAQQRTTALRISPLKAARESAVKGAMTKLSLLDFDIPPAPTPRSIPSVTPRELESLKSGYLSEISSLKATLSGREAEVTSLKQSVADAERRVGEALEEVRNECREALEAEWVERNKEMETIIQGMRAELIEGENERKKAEEGREHLEGRIVELESQLSAQSQNAPSVADARTVEQVGRELHTLYKGKHEAKVAALKKSYESRWEKRVRETEAKLQAALERNKSLKAEQQPDFNNDDEQKHLIEARIKGLQQEIVTVKEETNRLRAELEIERTEKGELVAVVDEWLAIQPQQQQEQTATLRRSVSSSRGTGIRPPNPVGGEKRLSRYSPGRPRPGSGDRSGIAVYTPGRVGNRDGGGCGIMGSIERMGRNGA